MIKQKHDLSLLIFLGLILLFLFSKNSWLYTATSSVDINSFMTTAHVWTTGALPYKDIFEQKGPLLYFIYAMAIKSGLWFRAIWLLEVFSLGVSLYLFQKIFDKLAVDRFKRNLLSLFYMIALTFPQFFDRGGGAEELSLVFIIYCLYLFTKVIQKEELQTIEIILAAIGVTLIFWIKYTMIMTYLVLITCYLIYLFTHRYYKTLLNILIINLTVFVAISSVIIIYFYFAHALPQLIKVYFYDNIFLYTNTSHVTLLDKLISWNYSFYKTYFMVILLALLPIIYHKHHRIRSSAMSVLLLVVLSNFVIFHYGYYILIILPIFIYLNAVTESSKTLLTAVLIIATVFSFSKMTQLTQTRFSTNKTSGEQIAQVTHGSGDIVQFGMLDTGIYNVTKQIPKTYYYQFNNIPVVALPELYQDPLHNIRLAKTKYIVTTKEMHELFKKSFKHYHFTKQVQDTSTPSQYFLIYERNH